MIANAFLRALSQFGDGRFQRVLALGVGLTIALLAGITWLFVKTVGYFLPDTVSLPWIGEIGWLTGAASGVTIAGMLVASVFLMVPVASAFTSIFLEDIADAVEDRFYPEAGEAPRTPWGTALADTLTFLVVILLANIAALILYLFFPPFAPFIFWGLNGFLLGREYFQITAMRRLGRQGAKELRRRHMVTIWSAGVLMAVPLTIPLVNLTVPVLGAAVFTHLFHLLDGQT